jgi:hypothetical protein
MLLCVGLPGCTGFGPNRLETDQLKYIQAITAVRFAEPTLPGTY